MYTYICVYMLTYVYLTYTYIVAFDGVGVPRKRRRPARNSASREDLRREREVRIPFGDHPLKLERYRED